MDSSSPGLQAIPPLPSHSHHLCSIHPPSSKDSPHAKPPSTHASHVYLTTCKSLIWIKYRIFNSSILYSTTLYLVTQANKSRNHLWFIISLHIPHQPSALPSKMYSNANRAKKELNWHVCGHADLRINWEVDTEVTPMEIRMMAHSSTC